MTFRGEHALPHAPESVTKPSVGPSKRVADKGSHPVHTRVMQPLLSPLRATLAFAAALALLAAPVAAQVNEKTEKAEKSEKPEKAEKAPDGGAACERAARQALANEVPNVADVSFDGAPALQQSLSNDTQVVLRGSGKHRTAGGVRSFSYSCNVDARTAQVVGLVMRDATPPPVAAAPAKPPAEPDLTHVSMEACESSAVLALKQRWPRVSQISFDGATRTFVQDTPTRGRLHGNGRAFPAPGSSAALFGFDCEVDPRDGRVIGTQLSG
jgi:hypothetical protein